MLLPEFALRNPNIRLSCPAHKPTRQTHLESASQKRSYNRLINDAETCRSQTATKQKANEPIVFQVARSHSPSCINSNVCRLKEEKVVYPPQTPIMKNSRYDGLTSQRPSGLVNPAKRPMINEPVTFTTNVPYG